MIQQFNDNLVEQGNEILYRNINRLEDETDKTFFMGMIVMYQKTHKDAEGFDTYIISLINAVTLIKEILADENISHRVQQTHIDICNDIIQELNDFINHVQDVIFNQ